MSKKLTVEEFYNKLSNPMKAAIKILEFDCGSKPITFQILKTGEIRTMRKANELFKNKTGTFKPLGREVWNKMTKQNYQIRLNDTFGLGMVEVTKFQSLTDSVTIKCKRCQNQKDYATGNGYLTAEFACQNCDRERLTSADMQQRLDEKFGKNEYEILEYTRSHKPIRLRHKCGMILQKRDSVKMLNMLGCPQCEKAKSKGERDIAAFLLKRKIPFQTEYAFSDLRGEKYPRRFDFAILEPKFLLIEYNGKQHTTSNSWGGEKALLKRIDADADKIEYCKEHNIPLLVIEYWEYKHINKILTDFLKFNDYPLGEYTSSEVETLDTEM